MTSERRRELRAQNTDTISISWTDADGIARGEKVACINASYSGLAFLTSLAIAPGTPVYIENRSGHQPGYCIVRYCVADGDRFVAGVELDETAKLSTAGVDAELDYYEFLQISPNAQVGTVQRVYRYLAGCYHPDNPETGNQENFLLLNRAYKVLSDPIRRAEYDQALQRGRSQPGREFSQINFIDGVDGELNRRLAVLAVLYRRCRANIENARVQLLELEAEMGFPREYLDFTTWYLRGKSYIVREDNADFSLTTQESTSWEANYDKIPILKKLLNPGANFSRSQPSEGQSQRRDHETGVVEIRAIR